MCKTEMFTEMVLRVTRMRSKSVQKIGIATYIIKGHNALRQAGIQSALESLRNERKCYDV